MAKAHKKINHIIRRITSLLIMFSLLFTESVLPTYSQSADCIKTIIEPIPDNQISIPASPGNTNNDKTFENIEPFADLDIPSSGTTNIISTCIHKSNGARILDFNPSNGKLTLSDSQAITDPVTSSDPAGIRGICTFNSIGNQLFFAGNGPADFGFDRIYPFNIDISNKSTFIRTQENNTNDFFIPSDFPTSVAVTPNDKFLVYLQAETTNNNLATIESIEIKSDMSISDFSLGSGLAKVVNAGSYLEFAKSPGQENSRFAFGVFSNLQEGKSGSGDGFGIFKTNQKTGANVILAEFKKGNPDFPLPELFKTSTFGGFSGFKLIQRGLDLFLFISYFENDPNNSKFQSFSYITKLVLFKINIRSDLTKTATISQAGSPVTTVFKTPPCDGNNFHGISGPVWVANNIVYVADNNSNQSITKGENYFVSYFIDWDLIPNADFTKKIMRISSIPVRTNQAAGGRNTDLVVTSNNKLAYVVTANTQEPTNINVLGYSLKQAMIACSLLKDDLLKSGLCDFGVTTTEEGLTPDTKQPLLPLPSATPPSVVAPPIIGGTGTAPLPPPITGGRPPEFGAPGRPPEFGNAPSSPFSPSPPSSTSQPTSPPSTFTQPSNLPKPPKPSSQPIPPTGQPSINEEPKLPEIPNIELIPSGTGEVSSETSLNIDVKDLDLGGEDQIIISPTIPHIVFRTEPVETPKIEPVKPGEGAEPPIVVPDSLPLASSSSSGTPPTLAVVGTPGSPPTPSSSSGGISITLPTSSSSSGILIPFISSSSSSSSSSGLPAPSTQTITPNCCSCETGKLVCTPSLIPTCDGGVVRCVGPFNKVIACCRGAAPLEICNGDDPTIGCLNSLTKKKVEFNPLLQRELFGKKSSPEPLIDQTPAQSSEIRGAIKAGSGGYLIYLKQDAKLKQKDLKNIIFIAIDNEQKITIIPGNPSLIGQDKLLVRLSFPNTLKSGVVTVVALINKGGGKKVILAKGRIKIFDSMDFANADVDGGRTKTIGLPIVIKIQGKVTSDSVRGGKIIRLTFFGENFASRLITINGQLFISEPFKSHTFLSFADESDIEILRTRVLPKGSKMLVTLRFTGDDITSRPFTISTPKGQSFNEKIEIKLFSKKPIRSVILNLDKEKDKKEEKK